MDQGLGEAWLSLLLESHLTAETQMGKDPLPSSLQLFVGRVHLLAVVQLGSCFLAGCQLETTLRFWRLPPVPWHLVLSQQGNFFKVSKGVSLQVAKMDLHYHTRVCTYISVHIFIYVLYYICISYIVNIRHLCVYIYTLKIMLLYMMCPCIYIHIYKLM